MGDHLHVVTGGPGSGKSSLIEALARRGIGVMPEAGRAIIRDQERIGGSALPWRDRALFAELMLAWELRSHGEAAWLDRPVAMDRGVPDVLGYLTLCGLPVPAHVAAAARLFRYNQRVFLAPRWDAIYVQDVNRHGLGTPDRLPKGTPDWARSETRPGAAVRMAETGRVSLRRGAEAQVQARFLKRQLSLPVSTMSQ